MADAVRGASDLDSWLAPFLEVMGRKTRRTWAPLYLRGLLGPGERKSLQPMAMRLGLSGHDQLQHFIASPAWDDAPLWTVLAREADRLVGGPDAFLVVDDTALPKKGELSVGVARQYCGQLGKKANCQSLVSVTLAQGEVPVPVGLRLFLPETWTEEPDRCARAGVPGTEMAPPSKGEIALAELDRLRAAGVRFGTVLADAGYGASGEFRKGLTGRGLLWAVGIPRVQKVYGTAVQVTVPPGRRRRPVPDEEPRPAEEVLAGQSWRRVTWRQGTKGALAARFAATRVRVGDGGIWANNRHLPGEEVWLVGEWRSSGERKYHLSNLGPDASLRVLASTIKARWICVQAHQQLKQELGLGHFDGRSWTGLHRHALMTCIAFAYLQHLRLAQHRRTSRGKNAAPHPGTATITGPARPASGYLPPAVRPPRQTSPMPALQTPVPAHDPL
ncbi:IS701 family transposase [Roseomonas populi]|uniref:IS701 family transposase n=1 Tax=Roseomonas populi TaxID=3121582 RepID=A0ABT1XBW3_9PROT|nr:IS701 family transposase [Roseomonas pecuniae]MCR0985616.1 IS701 family transposase [Roseomonas pecuniae]